MIMTDMWLVEVEMGRRNRHLGSEYNRLDDELDLLFICLVVLLDGSHLHSLYVHC